MNKTLLTSTGIALAAVLLLATNIISNNLFKSARIDLTDNNLYTLSEGSKNILSVLEEPVTLKFYLSQKLATELSGINSYTIRVKELLEAYAREANGNILLQIIDPEPFSEAEDQAVGYGLKGIPVDNQNTTFYFGLVGSNSLDGEESIGFFNPSREEFLEYDITQMVYKLSNPEQQTIGLMTTLEINGSASANSFFGGGGDEAWMIMDQVKQLFEVKTLDTTMTVIPADIDVLMLVHPKGFSDATLYAVDQFVLNGGRLLAFVDPYAETDEPVQDPKNPLAGLNAPRFSELDGLLASWGVELEKGKVVGDLLVSKKVQVRQGSRGVVIDYPIWMDLGTANFSADDIITAKLDDISVGSIGSLKAIDGATTKLIPLLQSSDKAMLIDTGKLGIFSQPDELARDFKPAGEQFIMAARVSGAVKTAFPDGAPKSDSDVAGDSPAVHLIESKEDINIILIADTDLLEDKFWVRVQNMLGQRIAIPSAANDQFVTNALDNLSGSNDLISVRNRGTFSRPFTRVEAIRQDAEQQFREKEKQLLAKLESTEKKLRDLQNEKRGGSALLLSAKQQAEIAGFRDEKITIRKELRGVQHAMQKNIESLETTIKMINIALIPFFVGIGGIFLGIMRSRRRRALNLV